jgi:hypothetical protein
MDESQRQQLSEFIEKRITDDPEDELDNAVCVCFLENLSDGPLAKQLRPYLHPRSLLFFDYWDSPNG